MAGRKHLADSLQTLYNLSLLVLCISIGSQQGLWPVHGSPKGKDWLALWLRGWANSPALETGFLEQHSTALPAQTSHLPGASTLWTPPHQPGAENCHGSRPSCPPFWLRASPHLWWTGKGFMALHFLILCVVEKKPKGMAKVVWGFGHVRREHHSQCPETGVNHSKLWK